MKQLPAAYQNHLDLKATTLCTCWRVTREDGIILGFTDHDVPIRFSGTLYTGFSGFNGSTLQSTSDLAVDDGSIEATFNDERITRNHLEEGRYDGARIEVWRVNWENPEIRIRIKTGILGEVQSNRNGFSAEMRGISSLLDQTVGRQFQYSCDANLGDDRCQLDLSEETYTGIGTVEEIIDRQSILLSGLTRFSDRWFDNGYIDFTSGELAGLRFHIKGHGNSDTNSSLSLWRALPFGLAVGDRANVNAGCDKSDETCRRKFGNFLNFQGFPHIPGNDFVTVYPITGEGHDGGKR